VAVNAQELYDMDPVSATTILRVPSRATAPRHPHWYRGPTLEGKRRVFCVVERRARGALSQAQSALAVTALAACALLAAGCGGGSPQNASEPAASFQLAVVHASFPSKQSIATPTALELQVRNTGASTVPNVAVTVDSFNYTSDYPGLAADKRPIWAIEQGPGPVAKPSVQSQNVSIPGGGQTAYVNTWALGALAPKHTQTFAWHVVPVKAGTYTVTYTVSAGLAGKAKAQLSSGAPVQGHFTVDIAPKPASVHVDPATGRVVPGKFP
jgi:hypothetical protein